MNSVMIARWFRSDGATEGHSKRQICFSQVSQGDRGRAAERDRKKRITVEMRTPACHWRRHTGFDSEVFAQLFPDITLPVKLRSRQMV